MSNTNITPINRMMSESHLKDEISKRAEMRLEELFDSLRCDNNLQYRYKADNLRSCFFQKLIINISSLRNRKLPFLSKKSEYKFRKQYIVTVDNKNVHIAHKMLEANKVKFESFGEIQHKPSEDGPYMWFKNLVDRKYIARYCFEKKTGAIFKYLLGDNDPYKLQLCWAAMHENWKKKT
jgi:hypothetical protein